MGNKSSKTKLNETLEQEYEKIGLPKVSNEDISNELEREIYIAINMVRYDPKRMSKLMKPLKDMDRLSKDAQKSVSTVKKMLSKAEGRAPLAYYSEGTKACKEVNEKLFSLDDEELKDSLGT